MSEASTDTSHSWAPAIRSRRRAILQRLGMGAATAMIFSPMFGWKFSTLWVTGYFLIQLLEMLVFAPITSGKSERMGPLRNAAGWVLLFSNSAAFGSLSIPLWMTAGPMGGVCAAILCASGAIYGTINSPGSRGVFAVTIIPHFLYMFATPFWMSWYGASPSFLTAVCVAYGVFGTFCLSTWKSMDRAAQAESAARLDADRRRAEAETAMTGRAAFLAAVGHDLRTPIGAIVSGAAELERGAVDGAARSQAALITDAGFMMKALLDDLLDHAKLGAGRMTVETVDFNLRSVIAQTVMFWQGEARARGLALRVEGASSVPAAVRGDPMRLRQILNNLISNAMKFTTEGSVTLNLKVWTEEPASYAVLIEVADTGPGMTTDQLDRLFTPFDQTEEGVSARHGGSGLGLSISRDLAHLMGGRLTARSRPGQGAAFTLSILLPKGDAGAIAPKTLSDDSRGDIVRSLTSRMADTQAARIVEDAPVEIAPAPEDPVEEVVEPDEGERPLRVLVVDDHDINRRAVELILTPLGCDIATAADGLLALAQCETTAFDVIFMDVRMPELDGREATRRLRAGGGINADVPVIAVTADTAPDDIAACMAAGMTYFVSKPLTPASLLGALNQVLSGAQDETAPAAAETVVAA
ncbi:ATP-binding protein [Brevundimonas subvibrioides]|uniref:ATP-binding protein n=1 Tax=Brevundimonas subvibrioides TaxID=74313 RepID=UPI0022B4B9F6|nr:ATP-binding protein [Brevundimonas subvibrioides]